MEKGETIFAQVVKDRQFRSEPLLAYLQALAGSKPEALLCYQSIQEPENATQRGLGTLFHFAFLANLRREGQQHRSKLTCDFVKSESFAARWVSNEPPRPGKAVNEIKRLARHSPPKDPNVSDLLITRHPSECTENDFMLREMPKPGESTLSRDLYHDLARMRIVQDLQVHAALSGCLEHMEELDHPDIQAYLEVCFFEAAVIQRTCAGDPEVVIALRKFLDQTIVRFFQNQDQATTALFWIRIAYSFETHLGQLHHLDEGRIRHLEEQLQELKNRPDNGVALSYEILLTQLFFMGHVHVNDLDRAGVMCLVTLWSERLTAEKPPLLRAPWLEEAANILFQTHRERIREELADSGFRQQAFRPMPFGSKESTWQGEFPQYVKEDYTINLVSGKTYRGDLLLGNEWKRLLLITQT